LAIVFNLEWQNGRLAIWELSESIDELYPLLRCEIPSFFKNKQRNIEWISSRILLQELLPFDFELIKDEFGKPHLKEREESISLSHCSQYTAVAVSERSIGIDIEHVSERIHRISDRFMNVHEHEQMPLSNQTTYKYLIWCAKEAVYKLYGRRAVDFSNHMKVLPFDMQDEGKLQLEFSKETPILYDVHYKVFENHTMAWVEK